MQYAPTARDLLKLYGQRFAVPLIGGGQTMTIQVPDQTAARTRSGLEAYGMLVGCQHPSRGNLSAFLKIFRHEIFERAERTQFLIDTGLTKKHPWIYHGVPFGWLNRFEVAGVPIIGHLALQIGAAFGGPAEDFGRLRPEWQKKTAKLRKKLASQLCVAVIGLERLRIVHGDLSPSNIMIGAGPSGEITCTLCDFDGFLHRSKPLLPRKLNGNPCRPLGSPGFQYPELLRRMRSDTDSSDPSIKVETDRFALGALCCELVVWSPKLGDQLGHDSLLGMPQGQATSLDHLPRSVRLLWPEGFDLLDKALAANTIADLPSPDDWLVALGNPPPQAWPPGYFPRLSFYKARGQHREPVRKVNLISKSGNFGKIDALLLPILYEFDGQQLTLNITWSHDAFVRPPSLLQQDGPGPRTLTVGPGHTILSNGWEIKVEAVAAASL